MIMEHEKLTKSQGICDQSWNLTNFVPKFYNFLYDFCHR